MNEQRRPSAVDGNTDNVVLSQLETPVTDSTGGLYANASANQSSLEESSIHVQPELLQAAAYVPTVRSRLLSFSRRKAIVVSAFITVGLAWRQIILWQL